MPNRLAPRAVPWLLLVLALAAARGDDEERGGAGLGAEVERLRFLDTRYAWRSLDEFGEKKAFVLVFVTKDCPLAGRYLPRLGALEKEYRDRGVQFVAVDVGRGAQVVETAAIALDHGFEFPIVQDPRAEAARAVGARRTPEVVVLDATRRLVYRGRVDGQFRVGGTAPAPGRADLREALEDVLAAREVRVAETEVDGCLIEFGAVEPEPAAVTWAEHVAPILRRSCEGCHRTGGEGPFPLATWEDARDRASTIAEVVGQGRMPPWFADPRHGEFENDPRLSAQERRILSDWARTGAPPGDLSRAPAPGVWPTGEWRIDEPDLVLQVPVPVQIPAEGYVPYRYSMLHAGAILPYVFPEDTWVQQIQIRPENPDALHHANLFYGVVGADEKEYAFVNGQVPGGAPMQLGGGIAFLVPKGAILGLQMHYVTTGVATTDRIRVGIVYAREPVRKRLRHLDVRDKRFAIPPGAPSHPVTARRKLDRDATGLGMFVHMHVRGRDMRFVAHYPDGKDETLLLVPNYSFDWQRSYLWREGEKRFPAGTSIECVAHYDNSAFNPFNPDPTATVRFGQQTYEEMMYGFFFYVEDGETLDVQVDPKTGLEVKRDR